MRQPEDLSPDELATLRQLWDVYPDQILMHHDRDHSKLDPLVVDGYVERTEYEQGIGYRMADEHAEGQAAVVKRLAEQAELN